MKIHFPLTVNVITSLKILLFAYVCACVRVCVCVCVWERVTYFARNEDLRRYLHLWIQNVMRVPTHLVTLDMRCAPATWRHVVRLTDNISEEPTAGYTASSQPCCRIVRLAPSIQIIASKYFYQVLISVFYCALKNTQRLQMSLFFSTSNTRPYIWTTICISSPSPHDIFHQNLSQPDPRISSVFHVPLLLQFQHNTRGYW